MNFIHRERGGIDFQIKGSTRRWEHEIAEAFAPASGGEIGRTEDCRTVAADDGDRQIAERGGVEIGSRSAGSIIILRPFQIGCAEWTDCEVNPFVRGYCEGVPVLITGSI